MLRIALVSMLCCLALAPAALADHRQTLTFEAPVDLLDPATRPQTMDEISSLGAHSLRVILYWKNVAPKPTSKRRPRVDLTKPSNYDWGQYDALLAAAKDRGWSVLLTVSGPAPRWATRHHRDYTTRPSPRLFQQFMTAVGRHYGDQVDMWSIWNEPNHPDFLTPQYRHGKPQSGKIYRGLFLAGWKALRATGNGRDTLLMGETAPIGTGHVVAPLTFLRQALCLDDHYRRKQGCSNLPATGYAHHAYTTAAGPFYKPDSPNAVTIGTLGRLVHALDRAARSGAVRRHMPIYLTEFGIQSYPDKISGVPLKVQPQYYAISEKIAYDNPRVVAFSQYLMRDDAPTGKGNVGGFGGFESGLKLHNGRKKPAYDGFRLPLVVTKKRHGRVAIWGHVRPATGRTKAVVQVSKGRRWKTIKRVRTDRRGYFRFRSSNHRGRTWRLTWRDGGHTYKGVRTQAYRAP
jgi:hypothetical protein